MFIYVSQQAAKSAKIDETEEQREARLRAQDLKERDEVSRVSAIQQYSLITCYLSKNTLFYFSLISLFFFSSSFNLSLFSFKLSTLIEFEKETKLQLKRFFVNIANIFILIVIII